jgi:hypothetical protein
VKVLLIAGGIGVAIAALVFGGVQLFSYMSSRSDSATAFANQVATAVVVGWNPASIEPFADEGFYKSLVDSPKSWSTYAMLGKAVQMPKCQVTNLDIVNGKATALAVCPGEFENGTGAVQVALSDHTGQWRVTDLGLQL